jgi:CRISPR-associated protein (TIGR03986 family)
VKHQRWRIQGTFILQAPLHVGSGGITSREAIVDQNNKSCDVAAVATDHMGKPCLPGTALKGVLRAWAERFGVDTGCIVRIFGERNLDQPGAQAGWAEFHTAHIHQPAPRTLEQFDQHVPYWNGDRLTGVYSNVCLDRCTGAARANKLFYTEFVPAGVTFGVEITATRLSEREITLLLALLEQGSRHPTHPYQFGANGADGWGRVAWKLSSVRTCTEVPANFTGVGFECCTTNWAVPQLPVIDTVPTHIALDLTLKFDGPFLVNDPARSKTTETNQESTNFVPLRCPDGSGWLPSSSFRGALRQRAELLLRTLNPQASGDPNVPTSQPGPIERIFGQTSQASRLHLAEFTEVGKAETRHQDFVAIDRFTGGAAEGAKFDATYLDAPTFTTRLTLDLAGLERCDLAVLALTLRDLCQGQLTFGFGGSKGYGRATAELKLVSQQLDPTGWGLPSSEPSGQLSDALLDWFRANLAGLYHPLPAPVLPASAPIIPPAVLERRGLLIKEATKKGYALKLRSPDKHGVQREVPLSDQQRLSPALRGEIDSLPMGELEVTFDPGPMNIRRVGQTGPPPASSDSFANPYYFLPLKDRKDFKGDLADCKPVGHERFHAGRYSGTLRVRLNTKTPLLVLDSQRAAELDDQHFSFPVLLDGAGRPLLASSSVRGMLRAAYEAITNSRFGVFPGQLARDGNVAEGHARRLGYRMPARTALATVPVRIEAGPGGVLRARLLPGTSHIDANGALATGDPQFAAWVGTYGWMPRGRNANGLGHGVDVWASIVPWQHNNPSFKFWNVEELIRATGQPCPTTAIPPAGHTRRPSGPRGAPLQSNTSRWVYGYLCVTNKNVNDKHDERLFFDAGTTPLYATLPVEAIAQWRELILDYQDQHRAEMDRGITRPPALNNSCIFSRHITTNGEECLKDGDLCHAILRQGKSGWEVQELYPVMITRRLYDRSPLELLPPSLQPATALEQLSPADRVFGWVAQEADNAADAPAYRSQVTVGRVTCVQDDRIRWFTQCRRNVYGPGAVNDPGLALAILGQPKPHQGRFYVGSREGLAQASGGAKPQRGYHANNRLRGPKVYPHHRDLAGNHWEPQDNMTETADAHRFREYLRLSGERDSQNRSIQGWIEPETEFTFDLHVTNLTRVELAALVWLLTLPENHYLRLGLGKPIGFGSVRVELDESQSLIAEGTAWATYLAHWQANPELTNLEGLRAEFEAVLFRINPELRTGFLKCAEGLSGLAVHYPRSTEEPTGSEAIYEWFGGNTNSLPDLHAPQPGLRRI